MMLELRDREGREARTAHLVEQGNEARLLLAKRLRQHNGQQLGLPPCIRLKEEAYCRIALHADRRQLEEIAAQHELDATKRLVRRVVRRWHASGAAHRARDEVELLEEGAIEHADLIDDERAA